MARLEALHEQLLQFTKNKLGSYGLSMTELGYVPKKVDTTLGGSFHHTGPAVSSENY
jgi:hypothetical protein